MPWWLEEYAHDKQWWIYNREFVINYSLTPTRAAVARILRRKKAQLGTVLWTQTLRASVEADSSYICISGSTLQLSSGLRSYWSYPCHWNKLWEWSSVDWGVCIFLPPQSFPLQDFLFPIRSCLPRQHQPTLFIWVRPTLEEQDRLRRYLRRYRRTSKRVQI